MVKMEDEKAEHNTKKSNVDGYGFERDTEFNTQVHDEFMSEYLPILTKRALRWQSLIGNKTKISKSRKVKRFCRKGIPNEHRSLVWLCLSGAQMRMMENPNTYRNILMSQKNEQILESIELDLHRTFPENIYFAPEAGLRKPLRNILVAVAHKNMERGYCQGQNFIAGLLLLLLKDEEKVFWLMDSLMNLILPDFYAPDMKSLKAEQELLGEIIKSKLPKYLSLAVYKNGPITKCQTRWKSPALYEHLEKVGVMWCLVGTKWFLCLFADVMPVETVFRIWDCMFCEGSKILLRVAAMVILQNEDKLMECSDFTKAVDMLKSITKNPKIVDCHAFMKKSFKELGSFPHRKLEKMREVCLTKVS